MLTALTIYLIRQYRLAGNRSTFFLWLRTRIQANIFRSVRFMLGMLTFAVLVR